MHPQSQQWLRTAKDNLKVNTVRRMRARMERLETLINNAVPRYGTTFVLDENVKKNICDQVLNAIEGYRGTKKLFNNKEISEKDVVIKTRTWWNRIKSVQLGSHLFVVICFYILHHFIQLRCESLSSTQQLVLFIGIFQSFVAETIKFPKTKPKPVIIQQCFLYNGLFKDHCAAFVQLFGDKDIRWCCDIKTVGVFLENGKRKHRYIKHKNRSETLQYAFSECLLKLKRKWCAPNNGDIEPFMQQWRALIYKSKPKAYDIDFSLSFCRSSAVGTSPAAETANMSAFNSDCNSSESSLNDDCTYPPRQFQGMSDFGSVACDANRVLDTQRKMHEKEMRARRQEQHIQQMRVPTTVHNNQNVNSNSTSNCDTVEPTTVNHGIHIYLDDYDIDFNDVFAWNGGWQSDEQVTYNVI